jgi:hypothetical protein
MHGQGPFRVQGVYQMGEVQARPVTVISVAGGGVTPNRCVS